MTDLAVHDVVALSATEARVLTDKIRRTLDDVWDLVRQAYAERAWQALDYPSWDAYCKAEFVHSDMRLPREKRGQVVGLLRASGLSVRAIAAATSSGVATVTRDLDRCSKRNTSAQIIGTDGKQYNANTVPTQQSSETASAPAPAPDLSAVDRATDAVEGVILGLQELSIDSWPPAARRKLARAGRQIVKMAEQSQSSASS